VLNVVDDIKWDFTVKEFIELFDDLRPFMYGLIILWNLDTTMWMRCRLQIFSFMVHIVL